MSVRRYFGSPVPFCSVHDLLILNGEHDAKSTGDAGNAGIAGSTGSEYEWYDATRTTGNAEFQ